jgi:ribonucleoside-diphosphate reductase beta chain
MEFACLLYSKIINRLPKAKVHTLIREAVKIEKKFITEVAAVRAYWYECES